MARRRRSGGKKKGSGAAGILLFLLLVAAIAAGAGAWLVMTPFGPETETFVKIAPGSSAVRIGRQLESAGVVRSRYAFDLVRWYMHGTLQAGTYRFDHPAPVAEVYARIARGDVYTKALTMPEGANIFDIAARAELAGLGTRQEFLRRGQEPDEPGGRFRSRREEPGGLPVSGHVSLFANGDGGPDGGRHGEAIPRRWPRELGLSRECASGCDDRVACGA